MLTDITLGQYFPGSSLIHKLDPRSKIISTILFITSIFMAQSYVAYGVITAFTIFVILLSQLPFRLIFRSIRPLWVILVLTFVIHMFFTPGTVIYHYGVVLVTQEGLKNGTLMTGRLVFLIVMSAMLTYTSSPIALTDGIERLLAPLKKCKVPVHELAMMMTIALRFIPTLLEETDRIMKAQMSRGADFTSGHFIRRAKNMVPLLVPLFVSAFRRADELAIAMEARCYRGGENRTRMKELQFKGIDCFAILITFGFALSLAYLRWS